MDVVLGYLDRVVLDKAWESIHPEWDRENIYRQSISLYTITLVGIFILYFGIAGGSYHFMFDKRMMRHPRFLKNQVRNEIKMSVSGFPWLDIMTLPWFLGECRGWSLMYEGIDNSPFGHGRKRGIAYIILSASFFLWFTDLSIYVVHRVLHWPRVYKRLHKPHHKWVIPTPFASHAFHPIDGYLQSLPYHMYVYIVPLHKYTYLGLFVFVNLWSIFIHDSDMITGHPLEHIINGPAHHTLHHMYFVVNYGQYFTWADKFGGSYRHPENKDDPLQTILNAEEAKKMLKEEKRVLAEQEDKRVLAEHERERAQSSNSRNIPSSNIPTVLVRHHDDDAEGEEDNENEQIARHVVQRHLLSKRQYSTASAAPSDSGFEASSSSSASDSCDENENEHDHEAGSGSGSGEEKEKEKSADRQLRRRRV